LSCTLDGCGPCWVWTVGLVGTTREGGLDIEKNNYNIVFLLPTISPSSSLAAGFSSLVASRIRVSLLNPLPIPGSLRLTFPSQDRISLLELLVTSEPVVINALTPSMEWGANNMVSEASILVEDDFATLLVELEA
jgi:hypothetical protein